MADYTFEIEFDVRSALQADAAIKYLAGFTRIRIDGFFNAAGQWWTLTKPDPLLRPRGVVAISGNTATLQDLKKNDLAVLQNFSYDVISGPIELRPAFAAQASGWTVVPGKQGKWTTRRHAYDPTGDGTDFIDDQGVQVLDRFGNGVLRPKTLDAHPILEEARSVAKSRAPLKGGKGLLGEAVKGAKELLGKTTADIKQSEDEAAFFRGQKWDAQRLGYSEWDLFTGKKVADRFVDYATILIGIYFAGASLKMSDCLSTQNGVAGSYPPWVKKDGAYPNLPVRNVANTEIGYALVNLGRIS